MAADDREAEIGFAILTTRATTLDGVRMKARRALFNINDLSDLEGELANRLENDGLTDAPVAVSIARDLVAFKHHPAVG